MTKDPIHPDFWQKCVGTFSAVAVIGGIGWLDYITGPQIGFSLFYLVPIILSGFYLGRTSAIVAALTSSAAWFSAEFAVNHQVGAEVLVWNGLTRIIIFLSIGVMTALLRRDRRRLQVLLTQASESARTDVLTGLSNLRAFQEAIQGALERARRDEKPVCVAYLDLDNFKKVNDQYGHSAGNQVLIRIAALLRSELRETDHPARLGGDESAVLLWKVKEEEGQQIAKRLLQGTVDIAKDYPLAGLSMSLGLLIFDEVPQDADTLMRLADAAMYEAKGAGKGRIIVRRVSTAGSATEPLPT